MKHLLPPLALGLLLAIAAAVPGKGAAAACSLLPAPAQGAQSTPTARQECRPEPNPSATKAQTARSASNPSSVPPQVRSSFPAAQQRGPSAASLEVQPPAEPAGTVSPIPGSATGKLRCTGRIEGLSGIPASFATIVLLRDGLQAAGATADSLGFFTLHVPPGNYTGRIRHLTFRPFEQLLVVEQPAAAGSPSVCDLGTFRLCEAATALQGVTVEAAAVRREADRFVLTVGDAAPLAGKDATELLAQAPGVWLDDKGIAINGSKGVKVFVDERELRLDGDRLTAYLRSLTAAEIARIEVIPQAGAEYAADARGGVLRIVLRRRRTGGMNGSVAMAARQSTRLANYAPSANLSLNAGKWTVSAAASGLFTTRGDSHYDESRAYPSDALRFAGRSDLGYRSNYGSGRLSVFFDPFPHHSFGAEAEYAAQNRRAPSTALTLIGPPETQTSSANGLLEAKIGYSGTLVPQETPLHASVPWDIRSETGTAQMQTATASRYRQFGDEQTLSAAFNYLWRIDTLGSGLKVLLDYTRRRSADESDYRTRFTFAEARTRDTAYRSTVASRYDLFSAETGLDLRLPHALKLLAGLKYTRNRLDDDTRYEGRTPSGWELRPAYSYTQGSTEQIAAAYGSLAAEVGRWSLSAGLRAEYTATDGRTDVVRRRYLDLFPHASVTVAFDRLRTWMLAAQYSRNIERPGFRSLNPTRIQFSDYNYQVGNPALRPTYIHRVSLTLIWKYRYTLTVGGNLHRDLIREVGKTDPADPRITYITPENHATENHWFAALSAPVKLTRRWRLTLNVVGVRQQLRLTASDPLAGHWLLFANATTGFDLPAKFYAELSYAGHSRLFSGNSEVEARHTLSASLKKRLCHDRLTLSVSVENLNGAREAYISHIGGLTRRMEGSSAWNARRCKISLTWNFRTGRAFKTRTIEAAAATERSRLGKTR